MSRSLIKAAVEAASPKFNMSDIYDGMRQRGIKNPEHPSLKSTINHYLIPAIRQYRQNKVETRVLTR